MKQAQVLYQNRIQNESSLLTFDVLADLHITLPWRNLHLETALEDIWQRDVKHVAIVGDFTNNGYAFQWKNVLSQLQEFPFQYAIALGNHDIYNIQHRSIHIHPLYRSMILRHHKHVYYDEHWNGIHIYVLNPQLATKQHGILFQDQLTWLRQKLKQDDPTKPILLFCHHPLSDLYVNSDSQKQKEELKMILHKYPNICYFSGHLHNDAALCEKTYAHCFFIDVPAFQHVETGAKQKGCGYEVQLFHDFLSIRTRDYLNHVWMASQHYILALNNHRVYVMDE